ncbi:hypothetical protein BACSTE_02574 [Bacteroides stercoris ATCC 43183]|uniref:Uncharacterized protein n=1 Tax=Bacteroides stercoris ATCC 43183 TaxID=449673 RepID=B0NSV9_BACSE|nr:hypothetical protein BACSTE_02574 [Bacteroides stercoris ATCC 43183]
MKGIQSGSQRHSVPDSMELIQRSGKEGKRRKNHTVPFVNI